MPINSPDKPRLTLEERRAKRAERREKQRVENAGRAAKMHKARLLKEANDKAQRPNDKRGMAKTENRLLKTDNSPPQLHIGCSGWFYWDWGGTFYPEGLPTNKWFQHYAKHFKTVELNAPFYSWPTVGTVKGWVRQVARKKFVYTVKVSERITHSKRFAGTKTLIKDFGFIADLLGDHMGCFLFQLPPSYNYTAGRLKQIVSQLDPRRRNVVEFRHKTWWNDKVYAAFRKAGIIFCCCSGPKLPEDLVTTADDIYVRFHGVKKWYRHDYSREELKVWATKIRASKAKRVWVYFNNDYDRFAIKNAKMLRNLLKAGSPR